MTTDETTRVALELVLPGRWLQLDPSDPEAVRKRLDDYLLFVNARDDEAHVRRQARDAVIKALESAPVTSMLLCHEIAIGVPLPSVVMVLEPPHLRMSPAVGTEPTDVARVFVDAAEQREGIDADAFTTIEMADAVALRADLGSAQAAERASADMPTPPADAAPPIPGGSGGVQLTYWVTVPGSKQMLVVSLMSPMTSLKQLLTNMMDVALSRSTFANTEPARDSLADSK